MLQVSSGGTWSPGAGPLEVHAMGGIDLGVLGMPSLGAFQVMGLAIASSQGIGDNTAIQSPRRPISVPEWLEDTDDLTPEGTQQHLIAHLPRAVAGSEPIGGFGASLSSGSVHKDTIWSISVDEIIRACSHGSGQERAQPSWPLSRGHPPSKTMPLDARKEDSRTLPKATTLKPATAMPKRLVASREPPAVSHSTFAAALLQSISSHPKELPDAGMHRSKDEIGPTEPWQHLKEKAASLHRDPPPTQVGELLPDKSAILQVLGRARDAWAKAKEQAAARARESAKAEK